jgi:hypothetical protein
MNLGKLAVTAIGFVADVLALKVLSAVSPRTEALLGRISGGFLTKDACAARARYNAAALDDAFPYVTLLLGQRPSRLIENMTDALADSAASRARQMAKDIEDYARPSGKALEELLPSASRDAVVT